MRGTNVPRMPAQWDGSVIPRLVAWYRQAGRDLPWRHQPTPYQVVVSELMLQQTTVATALVRYPHFLQVFPDFGTLAAASEDEVVAEWAGLGYYQRARHLSRLARQVSAHGLPSGETGWQALPGVGPYTAAAIVAFAEGGRALAIDVNVRRVLARMLALPGGRGLDRAIRQAVAPRLPMNSGELNQALIELGALICRPSRPDCASCPVATACAGRHQPQAYGRALQRPPVQEVAVHLVAVRRAGRLLVRQRTTRLLEGLWGLPEVAGGKDGLPPGVEGRAIPDPPLRFTHAFTHRRWRVRLSVVDGDGVGRWIDPLSPDVALAGPDRRAVGKLVAGGYLDG